MLHLILPIIILLTIILFIVSIVWIARKEPFVPKIKDTATKSDKLYSHLKFTKELLQSNGIKHWIMYGTLLGGVRQGDIIPYDWDFDFGCHVEDVDRIIALNPQIQKYGYSFVKPYRDLTEKDIGYSEDGTDEENKVWKVSVKVKYMGKSMGDIYFYKKCDDGFMRRYDPKDRIYFWPKATFPAWFVDELTMVKIRDSLFLAPRDPKVLLEHWYGSTWMIPIKAKAQGGAGDANSDYYGGAKKMQLQFLIDHVTEQRGYPLVSRVGEVPVTFVVPKGQIKWASENEGTIMYADK